MHTFIHTYIHTNYKIKINLFQKKEFSKVHNVNKECNSESDSGRRRGGMHLYNTYIYTHIHTYICIYKQTIKSRLVFDIKI